MHHVGGTVRTDRHGREVEWAEALPDLRKRRRVSGISRVIEPPRRPGHYPPGPEATVVIPERAPREVLRRHACDAHAVERHRLPPGELDRLSPGAGDPFAQAHRHDESNAAPRELLHAPKIGVVIVVVGKKR